MKADIEKQFIEACDAHSDALFRYCFFKISDKEVAKDLVQETFMKAWNYLVKGEEVGNIRAFFYKILGNLIVDEYRKKKTVSLESLEEGGLIYAHDEKEMHQDRIDGEIALGLLREIGDAYKDVIMMRYVEDLSLEEIADITKESKNAVAVKIHRGLKKVREIFKHKTNAQYE